MTMNTTTMHAEISEAFSDFKAIRTSRRHRMDFAESLAERYFAEYGKMPDGKILDRLTSLILLDDSSEKASNKTRVEEYPVLTENQYRRRTEGRHMGRLTSDGKLKPLQREVPFTLAATVATDGRNYAYPTRRSVDVLEQMDIEYYGKGGVSNDD